jgi:MFS family permease
VTVRARLARVLPAGRDRRRYVGISLIDATGTGAFAPLTILYLTQIVHIPAVHVGLAIAITGAVGIVATSAAGAIVDRTDSRIVAAVSFVVCGVGFLLLTRVDSLESFLLVGTLIQVAERLAQASRRMVAFAVAEGADRVELLAYERSTRNAGYGLGGLLASIALAGGTREFYVAILVANGISFFVASAGIASLPSAPPAAAQAVRGYRDVLRDRRYLALASVTMFLWINDSILKVGFPLWLVSRTAAPAYLVGLLFTLNTVLVVALQVRSSRGGASLHGVGRAYHRAGFVLLASCLLFAVAAHVDVVAATVLLVSAVVALTLGELNSATAEWGASIGLAREELRGRYLAVFATGASAQQAVGPALVTFLLVRAGGWAWLAMGAVMLAAGMAGRELALGALRAEGPEPGSRRPLGHEISA